MQHRLFRTVVVLVAVVALATVSFLAGRAFIGSRVSHAQGEVNPSMPADINASFSCSHVDNVAAFDSRIHVRCSTVNVVGTDNVRYYAYATNGSNGYIANRMLAVSQTAFALGKGAVIFYDPDSAHNPPGCYTSDCRLILGISMVE
jgi:hypothetical protein